MRRVAIVVSATGLAVLGYLIVDAAEQGSPLEPGPGWTTLFDGTSLDKWEICTSSGHGNTQNWKVVGGAIEGSQDKPGNGGVILSKGSFGDFLLELDINPDWGLDSGIFLRSTDDGRCYQVMVDYYEGGNVGGIYGEGIGGFGAAARDWAQYYNRGEWNRVLVLITGNPPQIDVWLNGHHVSEWRDDGAVKLDATGRIGLQVHAGDRYFGKTTRFRNIRIRELGSRAKAEGQ